MIIPSRPSWLRNLFRYRGTALRRIWRRLLFTVMVSVIITFIDLGPEITLPGTDFVLHYQFHDDLTHLPFSLVGLALGIFLGFRNNTSYDRFWEGRKLWGRMVNTSRSITRQILTLIGPLAGATSADGTGSDGLSTAEREELTALHEELVRRVAAYVHAFRMHLRDQDAIDELVPLIDQAEVDSLREESNRPIAMLQTLGDRFREAWRLSLIHI